MGYKLILRVVRRAYSQSDSPGSSTGTKSCAYDCFVFFKLTFLSMRHYELDWVPQMRPFWIIGVLE